MAKRHTPPVLKDTGSGATPPGPGRSDSRAAIRPARAAVLWLLLLLTTFYALSVFPGVARRPGGPVATGRGHRVRRSPPQPPDRQRSLRARHRHGLQRRTARAGRVCSQAKKRHGVPGSGVYPRRKLEQRQQEFLLVRWAAAGQTGRGGRGAQLPAGPASARAANGRRLRPGRHLDAGPHRRIRRRTPSGFS